MRRGALVALAAALACLPAAVRGDGLIPGPGEGGHDAALAAKADGIDRQIHTFPTRPFGWGLEATVPDPAERAAIDEFFAAGAADFQAHTGLHPYDVIGEYGESGDLGMFGGVQAAGDAFRYAVLRDAGADPGLVDAARAALVRAMDRLHWYTLVTGEPGCVARGLLRIVPEAGDRPERGGERAERRDLPPCSRRREVNARYPVSRCPLPTETVGSSATERVARSCAIPPRSCCRSTPSCRAQDAPSTSPAEPDGTPCGSRGVGSA